MIVKEAICDVCGKQYLVNKYISLIKYHVCDNCKGKRKHICPICGKEFIGTYKQKICSSECKKIQHIIPTLIKYFNFNELTLKTNKVFDEVKRIKDILYNEYWVEQHSSSEICNKYNYPNVGNLTAKLFKYLGIKSKTLKESNHENYLHGRIKTNILPVYKQQWHTTWNGKEVYLHSSYELDYAKELDKEKINYDVECLRIKYWDSQKQEYRCAIPDFYLICDNTIVEIKSSWTLDKQNMKDKMKAYKELGYNFKLICDHQEIEI